MSNKSFELIERWIATGRHKKGLEAQLKEALREERIALVELGAFLTPADAQPGEIFNLWIGDAVLKIWYTAGAALGTKEFAAEWRNGKQPMRGR